jgi:cytochrome c peroxidase
MRILLLLLLLTHLAGAAQLTVQLQPRWGRTVLKLDALEQKNAAGNELSVTRLAMLLSHAELQRVDGSWIGAADWVAYVDAGQPQRLSFTLTGIPAGQYQALRFDIGLDEKTDRSSPALRPAGHALHPDVNGLHWSWRGQYVFLAVEGRYLQVDRQVGGYSYHLAGQDCRSTVQVPVEMDMSRDQQLTLGWDVEQIFKASHLIDITAADSTHSAEEDELAMKLADNAVQAFTILQLQPAPQEIMQPVDAKGADSQLPALLKGRIPGHFPQVQLPADNPLTPAGVALGKVLFHDTRLSINDSQSCASCHEQSHAFSDARQVSLGAEGQLGRRNAMPLMNLAWKTRFFWDGRAPSLRAQVLQPIQDPTEMHETLPQVMRKLQDLAPQFAAAFGTAEVTAERMAQALEQYLLTLISAESAMDLSLTQGKPLSSQAQRGFQLFFTESDPARGIKGADCFHCHGGAQFTNYQFMNNGLDGEAKDRGLAEVTGRAEDEGKFSVPSLRNVALTAPYMHDGRFATLEQVIDHYDHGIKRSPNLDPNLAKHLRSQGLRLSAEDRAALLAFLHSLTDQAFVRGDK